MTTQEVTIKSIPAQRIVSVRGTIPADASIAARFNQVMGILGPNLPPLQEDTVFLALYYNMPGQDWDIEIGFTVPDEFNFNLKTESGETITTHALPAVSAAAAYLHKGSYEGLGGAYETIMGWMTTNGYRVVGPSREIYLNSPEDTAPENLLTEIQFPVMKAG